MKNNYGWHFSEQISYWVPVVYYLRNEQIPERTMSEANSSFNI